MMLAPTIKMPHVIEAEQVIGVVTRPVMVRLIETLESALD